MYLTDIIPMKISVVIPHFYSAREPNLRVIADTLRAGTVPPDEILVWNNDVAIAPIDGVQVFESPRNLGCLGRFVASYAARGEYILFHDNDMAVAPTTVERLLLWAKKIPHSIVSVDGWSFTAEKNYSQGVKTLQYGTSVRLPMSVDVTPGHIELLDRSTLYKILSVFPFEDSTVMEDLWFNACAQRVGVKRYVVPTDFKYLPDYGMGISTSSTFNEERDALCRKIL